MSQTFPTGQSTLFDIGLYLLYTLRELELDVVLLPTGVMTEIFKTDVFFVVYNFQNLFQSFCLPFLLKIVPSKEQPSFSLLTFRLLVT